MVGPAPASLEHPVDHGYLLVLATVEEILEGAPGARRVVFIDTGVQTGSYRDESVNGDPHKSYEYDQQALFPLQVPARPPGYDAHDDQDYRPQDGRLLIDGKLNHDRRYRGDGNDNGPLDFSVQHHQHGNSQEG